MATKGYDDTPVRNGLILFYTILTLFSLVLVKYTLDSYFLNVMNAEVHDKVLSRGMEPVKALRDQENKQLQSGNTPIDRAMLMLAQRGRAVSPMIAPKSGMGEDGRGMEEVQGWTKLNRKITPMPRPEPAPAAEPAAPAGSEGGAGGSAPAGATGRAINAIPITGNKAVNAAPTTR